MRSYLYLAALVFLIGGALAMGHPRVMMVSHPTAKGDIPGRAERVTEKQAVLYGLIAWGLGIGSLYVASNWNKWQAEVVAEERSHHHNFPGDA